MEIQSEPGRFFIEDSSGKMLAEIKYLTIKDGKVLDIIHTFVDDSLRGKGIAGELLHSVVNLATATNAKIIPTCSYAKSAFIKNSKYRVLQYEESGLTTDEIIHEKKLAGMKSAELVENHMTVGLGTGSTVFYLVEALAKRVKEENLEITAVATSSRTAELAKASGISIKSIDEIDHIDLTIDGADEIDANFQGIKGGGGALTLEKVVATASNKIVWIVDESKMVKTLGAFALPVEVIPFGSAQVFERLKSEGFNPKFRLNDQGDRSTTHNKNYIIDLEIKEIRHPHLLANWLDHQVGILEHGLFLDLVDTVIVGNLEKADIITANRK